MYTGNFSAVSNREDFQFTLELTDPSNDTLIDLAGATIKVAVREQNSATPVLTASTDDGKVTVTGPGTALVAFPAADMQALVAGSHDVGITVKVAAGTTYQLLAAALPVIDGVVEP